MLMMAIGGAGAMGAWFGTQSTLTHESCHSLAPALLAFGSQRCMNARAAIYLAVRLIQPHNPLPQRCILLAAAAGRPPQPGIIATHRHPQDPTHGFDRILLLVLDDKAVLHL